MLRTRNSNLTGIAGAIVCLVKVLLLQKRSQDKTCIFLHQLFVRIHMASRWHPSRNEDLQMMSSYTYQWVSPLGIHDCFVLTFFEWAFTLWPYSSCDSEAMWASEIKQRKNIFFEKSGIHPIPPQFWKLLIAWALLLIAPLLKATTLIEFFLLKYLKLICTSLFKDDKIILENMAKPI